MVLKAVIITVTEALDSVFVFAGVQVSYVLYLLMLTRNTSNLIWSLLLL
jgi:hypothetical protein